MRTLASSPGRAWRHAAVAHAGRLRAPPSGAPFFPAFLCLSSVSPLSLPTTLFASAAAKEERREPLTLPLLIPPSPPNAATADHLATGTHQGGGGGAGRGLPLHRGRVLRRGRVPAHRERPRRALLRARGRRAPAVARGEALLVRRLSCVALLLFVGEQLWREREARQMTSTPPARATKPCSSARPRRRCRTPPWAPRTFPTTARAPGDFTVQKSIRRTTFTTGRAGIQSLEAQCAQSPLAAGPPPLRRARARRVPLPRLGQRVGRRHGEPALASLCAGPGVRTRRGSHFGEGLGPWLVGPLFCSTPA